jgi:hypothetical protein
MSNKYVIFHIDGGAGKSILATAVVESIKNFYPDRKIIVVTPYPEVFLHNTSIYRVYKSGLYAYFYDDFVKDKDSIILKHDPYNSGDFINKSKHLIDIWCDTFNIPSVTLIPKIFLTQRELYNAAKIINKQGPVMLIHSNGGGDNQDYDYSWARDLPISVAQDIVNSSKDKFNKILHIRRENQPKLENVTQVTDNLRNLFCYTFLADKLILIDSVIQHAAAAFNKKAAVGWIANSPNVFGHQCHVNIKPSSKPSFRHMVDSYFEDYDWVGRRLYECPYNDLDNLFDRQEFLNYLSND